MGNTHSLRNYIFFPSTLLMLLRTAVQPVTAIIAPAIMNVTHLSI